MNSQPEPFRLPVAKVVLGAFLIPWMNRRAFVRALAIPALLLVSTSLGWAYVPKDLPLAANWGLQALNSLLYTIFAVVCHRLVLLDPISEASRVVPQWTKRESRFYFWMMAFWGLFVAFSYGSAQVLMSDSIPGDNFWLRFLGGWFASACLVLAYYAFARLSVMFPATAVDATVNLKWAWELTAGNGWRLFLIVCALPMLFGGAVDALYRDGATTAEIIVLGIAGTAIFAVEIAAVSLSYRELLKNKVPPS